MQHGPGKPDARGGPLFSRCYLSPLVETILTILTILRELTVCRNQRKHECQQPAVGVIRFGDFIRRRAPELEDHSSNQRVQAVRHDADVLHGTSANWRDAWNPRGDVGQIDNQPRRPVFSFVDRGRRQAPIACQTDDKATLFNEHLNRAQPPRRRRLGRGSRQQ